MNPKETIKKNLQRRSEVVDVVDFYKSIPMPSWIELSLIDACNRKCTFCPKVDPIVAPDTFQKMNRKVIDAIHDQLLEINFSGIISLCGYGEPLLHKDINYIKKKLSNVSRVEVITNGDVLSTKRLQDLFLNDVSKVLVSMYDGPEQIEKFNEMTRKANVPEEMVILRDRWYDKYNDFGVKLTNRAGTINAGQQEPIGSYSKCYYPSYQFLIDWNGDIFLCPQDWHRRNSMGNMMQESIYNIWTSSKLSEFRKNLLKGDRCAYPCKTCNANGAMLGSKHADEWRKIYKL